MLRDSVAHLDISLHGSAISLLQDKVSVKVEAPIMMITFSAHLVETQNGPAVQGLKHLHINTFIK